ncbi:MAG: hypothetical protein E3J90_12320 [Promethearchaeota archaeon]|nr:MAG: hypothetical protein E3J90_12320 [Candidatus Lokiarchaeota archaeon]
MRVFVSDVIVKTRSYWGDYYWVVGRLQSGMEVIIEDNHYDLRECIGSNIDMLLSFMRSPYSEQKRGIHSRVFLPFKYYSVELVDELLGKKKVVSTDNKRATILTGEYIDSYTIPEKWAPLPQRGSFEAFFKEPSALKTEDGVFLLNPFHSERRVPIEQIPREVTMVGGLSLEAWKPSQ